VLLLWDGRLWWKGAWYDRDVIAHVVHSVQPWEIIDLSSVVIEVHDAVRHGVRETDR
jgi:hypothetical protein